MPTELEELVEFIHHGNTPIRQLAVENLVPFSLSQPAIFKTNQLLPVRDLKLLVKDYPQIAKNAITMLINLSTDREVLECLATDDRFVESLMARITNPTEPNANELSMLFANLGHHDSLTRLLTQLIKPQPNIGLPSPLVIDQLVDLFVRADKHNPAANYDYLSYVFADLAKHAGGRKYFTTRQKYDGVIPLTKMTVFTEHKSPIRRRGVASTIKNVAFELDAHPSFLSTEDEEVNILPFILLPLTGSETYSDEEMLDMLPDLQLLPPDKEREPDVEILKAHVETLMILSSSRDGREKLREAGTYYVVRETHLRVEDEGVREVCDRLVQVLMRDEEGESGETNGEEGALVKAGDVNGVGRVVEEDDEDEKIVEV